MYPVRTSCAKPSSRKVGIDAHCKTRHIRADGSATRLVWLQWRTGVAHCSVGVEGLSAPNEQGPQPTKQKSFLLGLDLFG